MLSCLPSQLSSCVPVTPFRAINLPREWVGKRFYCLLHHIFSSRSLGTSKFPAHIPDKKNYIEILDSRFKPEDVDIWQCKRSSPPQSLCRATSAIMAMPRQLLICPPDSGISYQESVTGPRHSAYEPRELDPGKSASDVGSEASDSSKITLSEEQLGQIIGNALKAQGKQPMGPTTSKPAA